MQPEWEYAGKHLKSIAKLAVLDAENDPHAGGPYVANGLPSIVYFTTDKTLPHVDLT